MVENMTRAPDGTTERNYYDVLFERLSFRSSVPLAVELVAEAYLDGKQQMLRKRRTTRRERDKLFWSSRPVIECVPESWNSEVMVLALARYLGQEPVAAVGLLSRVAKVAPAALVRAVRYSGLVLNQHSPRRTELDEAAVGQAEVLELCRVLTIFDRAYRDRLATLHKALLADLSAFDLLVYASLAAAAAVAWCLGSSRLREGRRDGLCDDLHGKFPRYASAARRSPKVRPSAMKRTTTFRSNRTGRNVRHPVRCIRSGKGMLEKSAPSDRAARRSPRERGSQVRRQEPDQPVLKNRDQHELVDSAQQWKSEVRRLQCEQRQEPGSRQQPMRPIRMSKRKPQQPQVLLPDTPQQQQPLHRNPPFAAHVGASEPSSTRPFEFLVG